MVRYSVGSKGRVGLTADQARFLALLIAWRPFAATHAASAEVLQPPQGDLAR